MSSPMVLPGLNGSISEPDYFDDAAQETRVRHRNTSTRVTQSKTATLST